MATLLSRCAPAYIFPAITKSSEVRERPLWSALNEPERQTIADELKYAYEWLLVHRDDPRNLLNQAWIHKYYCSDNIGQVNIHNSWYFLPWHRAFLYFHEQILQSVLKKPEFRLPIWDWDHPTKGQVVPPAYQCLPPCAPPLIAPRARQPKLLAPITPCILKTWMISNNPDEFLGGDGVAGSSSSAGDAFGGPHSFVHTSLRGYMSDVKNAAVDPLFYAHHANIDRFFQHWLDRNGVPKSPADPIPFHFVTGDGKVVSVDVAQMMHMKVRDLGYDFPRSSPLLGALEKWVQTPLNLPDIAIEGSFGDWLAKLLRGAPTAALVAAGSALEGNGMIPVAVTFPCHDPFVPGQAYLIEVKSLKKPYDSLIIGGFGTAGGHHAGSNLTVAICISKDLISFVKRNGPSFNVVFAPPTTDRLAKDIVVPNFELLQKFTLAKVRLIAPTTPDPDSGIFRRLKGFLHI